MRKATIAMVGIVAALLLVTKSWVRAAGKEKVLRVYVSCSGDDAIGGRVCYAVKEKLRASRGFELTSTTQVGGFCVHLVSIDDTPPGYQNLASAIAETITGNTAAGQLYLTTSVVIVGASRVQEIADSIVANLDQETDFMR